MSASTEVGLSDERLDSLLQSQDAALSATGDAASPPPATSASAPAAAAVNSSEAGPVGSLNLVRVLFFVQCAAAACLCNFMVLFFKSRGLSYRQVVCAHVCAHAPCTPPRTQKTAARASASLPPLALQVGIIGGGVQPLSNILGQPAGCWVADKTGRPKTILLLSLALRSHHQALPPLPRPIAAHTRDMRARARIVSPPTDPNCNLGSGFRQRSSFLLPAVHPRARRVLASGCSDCSRVLNRFVQPCSRRRDCHFADTPY